MKRFLAAGLVFVTILLTGCAGAVKDYNDRVAAQNKDRRDGYATAMAACKGDSGCQVGVTFAFATGVGQQNFKEPDTVLDYVKGSIPILEIAYRFYGGMGSGGMRDGNVVFNNVKFGRDALFSGFNKTSTYTSTQSNGNRTYSLTPSLGYGQADDGGVQFAPPLETPITKGVTGE